MPCEQTTRILSFILKHDKSKEFVSLRLSGYNLQDLPRPLLDYLASEFSAVLSLVPIVLPLTSDLGLNWVVNFWCGPPVSLRKAKCSYMTLL